MDTTGPTSSSSWSDTSQNNSSGSSGRRRDRLCKVVGCTVDLCALNKPYCLKRGVCPDHLKADAVCCKGAGEQLWRFCQQCGKMEHLQLFSGKNRSCKDGLARRRQKSMLRQQLQKDWQQQEQQLQAMHDMDQQQQQEVGSACWGINGWQQLQADLAAPQAKLSMAFSGMAWSADAATFDAAGINGSSSRSSTHSAPLLVPAAAPCSPAVIAPQQPAAPACNHSSTSPQQLLQMGGNAAVTAATSGPMAAPFCSSVGIDAFKAGSGVQCTEQAVCGAGAGGPASSCQPAGFLQVPASLTDAELDAIIAEELQAAGLQVCSESTRRPAVMSAGAAPFQPAVGQVAAPPVAAAPVSAAGVVAPIMPSHSMLQDQAAQYAKLHALMAELDELNATLQQLQQAQGLGQQVGSVMTRY